MKLDSPYPLDVLRDRYGDGVFQPAIATHGDKGGGEQGGDGAGPGQGCDGMLGVGGQLSTR